MQITCEYCSKPVETGENHVCIEKVKKFNRSTILCEFKDQNDMLEFRCGFCLKKTVNNSMKNHWCAERQVLNKRYNLKIDHPLLGNDSVNNPKHYNFGKIEVLEAIKDWALNFSRGNAVKYIVRAGKKDPSIDKEIEDLKKAIFYLRYEIENLVAKREGRESRKPCEVGVAYI